MVVGGSQQETLYIGFVLHDSRQQDVPVILRVLILLDGFDPVSYSFTVRDVYIFNIYFSFYRMIFVFSMLVKEIETMKRSKLDSY
ncbi:unnamed protein product [Schistosoma margrebowiei]|uniref:Uncharacterized protein n=1 Tax=Schistosoma margrebowiei TaxID=48269 RepID=A0A183M145_9TREM|nr:unnamed protein product [Schistosoma margrebowiei]